MAQVASAAERSADKDRYEEYMCRQCGDLYSRATYKIIEVPLSGDTPAVTPVVVKKECPAVTQELVGPSKFYEEEEKPKVHRPTPVVKV